MLQWRGTLRALRARLAEDCDRCLGKRRIGGGGGWWHRRVHVVQEVVVWVGRRVSESESRLGLQVCGVNKRVDACVGVGVRLDMATRDAVPRTYI